MTTPSYLASDPISLATDSASLHSHEDALVRADLATDALGSALDRRWYPRFHIAARAGWINDPNGLCHYSGRYHVFFQHHPYSAEWGPMHWGHVSSSDLVTWHHEPEALAPSLVAERDGVWSGSAVRGDDGRLHVFYTAHRWRNGTPKDDEHYEVQCHAVSSDGVHFEKLGAFLANPERLDSIRDPKVFKVGDVWYMVIGMTNPEHCGQVLLLSSPDLTEWTFEQVLFRHPNPRVYMLECPDFFPLGDKWVLSFSALGIIGQGKAGFMARNEQNTGYIVGTWKPGAAFLPETDFVTWDWGRNYYAPQSFSAPDGRTLQLAWMSPFTMPHPEQPGGWCGQMTLVRELSLGPDGVVRCMPAREVKRLRKTAHEVGTVSLGPDDDLTLLEGADGLEAELTLNLAATAAERVGLKVHAAEDGSHVLVAYDAQTSCVVVDRHCTANGDRGYRAAPVEGDTLKLRVFVDRASVEVYVNDGERVLSSYSFPAKGPLSTRLTTESGTATFEGVRVWELGSIWD